MQRGSSAVGLPRVDTDRHLSPPSSGTAAVFHRSFSRTVQIVRANDPVCKKKHTALEQTNKQTNILLKLLNFSYE